MTKKITIIIEGPDDSDLLALAQDAITDINSMDGAHNATIKKSKFLGGKKMPEEKEKPTVYLGDGVYAIFDDFGIWLHTNSHRPEEAADRIFLEPQVLESLNTWYQRIQNDVPTD